MTPTLFAFGFAALLCCGAGYVLDYLGSVSGKGLVKKIGQCLKLGGALAVGAAWGGPLLHGFGLL